MVNCDHCGKPATRNYQKLWVVWKHNPRTGSYSKRSKYLGCDVEEPTGEDSLHYCDECSDKFESGEI
jgi:hypothetical protein